MELDNKILYDIATDRRLSSLDVRVWMYFLSQNNGSNSRQEEVSDVLNVTRENLNRSITKLKLFGYISTDAISDYYTKHVYNIDTGEREHLLRKARNKNVTYIAQTNLKEYIPVKGFMELMNIDTKNKDEKLLVEDDYKNKGDIFYNTVTEEYKDELTELEQKDNKWQKLTKVEVVEYNYYDSFLNLIKLYEKKYKKEMLRERAGDYSLSMKDTILIVGLIEQFRGDLDKNIYEPILKFKNKFLILTIEQYLKAGVLDDEFLIRYNTLNRDYISKIEIKRDYLMSITGFKNRDTSHTRKNFEKFISKTGYTANASFCFEDVINMFTALDKTAEKAEKNVDFAIRDGVFNLSFKQFKEIYGKM